MQNTNTNKIYGYLRGSTSKIDLQNQKLKIAEKYNNVEYITDVISSKKSYHKRAISTLIDSCKSGDRIVGAEISRFARDLEQSLMIVRMCLEKNVTIEILNPALVFDGSFSSKNNLMLLGMVGELERDFIVSRIRISLEKKKDEIKQNGFFISKSGKKVTALGAPAGIRQKMKLEDRANDVLKYKNAGLSNRASAKALGVAPITLGNYLKRFVESKEGKFYNKQYVSSKPIQAGV